MKSKYKNYFDVEKLQKQIDFLNKNPHLKISTEGMNEKEVSKLYKKHFKIN